MAKPLQQDSEGNIIGDVETAKNQKGAAAYEAELANKQARMEAKDQATKDKYTNLLKSGLDMLSRSSKVPEGKAKGGKISSASSRADGCCIRGKTRA